MNGPPFHANLVRKETKGVGKETKETKEVGKETKEVGRKQRRWERNGYKFLASFPPNHFGLSPVQQLLNGGKLAIKSCC